MAAVRGVERRKMVPETNQELSAGTQQPDIADESPSERGRSDGIELKGLRAAFRKLEESKEHIVSRVMEIRRVSADNAGARAQVESDVKDTKDQLAESNRLLRDLKQEVSTLKAELNTARALLEEIDKTLT